MASADKGFTSVRPDLARSRGIVHVLETRSISFHLAIQASLRRQRVTMTKRAARQVTGSNCDFGSCGLGKPFSRGAEWSTKVFHNVLSASSSKRRSRLTRARGWVRPATGLMSSRSSWTANPKIELSVSPTRATLPGGKAAFGGKIPHEHLYIGTADLDEKLLAQLLGDIAVEQPLLVKEGPLPLWALPATMKAFGRRGIVFLGQLVQGLGAPEGGLYLRPLLRRVLSVYDGRSKLNCLGLGLGQPQGRVKAELHPAPLPVGCDIAEFENPLSIGDDPNRKAAGAADADLVPLPAGFQSGNFPVGRNLICGRHYIPPPLNAARGEVCVPKSNLGQPWGRKGRDFQKPFWTH